MRIRVLTPELCGPLRCPEWPPQPPRPIATTSTSSAETPSQTIASRARVARGHGARLHQSDQKHIERERNPGGRNVPRLHRSPAPIATRLRPLAVAQRRPGSPRPPGPQSKGRDFRRTPQELVPWRRRSTMPGIAGFAACFVLSPARSGSSASCSRSRKRRARASQWGRDQ